MDVLFQHGNETFVWNAEKAAGNLAKHGITFRQACQVFADPMLLLEDASVGDEFRTLGIGILKNFKLVCVVHVIRENECVRIISAWQASASERDRYEDNP